MKRLWYVLLLFILAVAFCFSSESKAILFAGSTFKREKYNVVDMNDIYLFQTRGIRNEYRLDITQINYVFDEGNSYRLYVDGEYHTEFNDRKMAEKIAEEKPNAYITVKGLIWSNNPKHTFELYNFLCDEGRYAVYQNYDYVESFNEYRDALDFSRRYANTYILGETIIWHNYPPAPYEELVAKKSLASFDDLLDTLYYCRNKDSRLGIIHMSDIGDAKLVWQNTPPIGAKTLSGVPYINQNPELARGCEVTSLAMMLNYYGVETDKMRLAEEIKKSSLRYDDPNNGFVGNIYTFEKHGLGVYHTPIMELAEQYMPGDIYDLTGCHFEDLFYLIDNDTPVWIITNSRYAVLPPEEFVTWRIPGGEISVTYREHSVVITGYDGDFIYFHDPLVSAERKSDRKAFQNAWEQMGRQAVAVIR